MGSPTRRLSWSNPPRRKNEDRPSEVRGDQQMASSPEGQRGRTKDDGNASIPETIHPSLLTSGTTDLRDAKKGEGIRMDRRSHRSPQSNHQKNRRESGAEPSETRRTVRARDRCFKLRHGRHSNS